MKFRGLLFPTVVGLTGCAILIWLGFWQVQRLQWKEEILLRIENKITAPPTNIPSTPLAQRDTYRSVHAHGVLTGQPLFVIVSPKNLSAGYRYIRAFEAQGRRILVDMGWVPLESASIASFDVENLKLTGNLHWPDEVDEWTPEPDASGVWFARDVEAMADALETEPVLLVVRSANLSTAPTGELPDFHLLPIDRTQITNDHLSYAMTWFALAFVWASMSFAFIYKLRLKDN